MCSVYLRCLNCLNFLKKKTPKIVKMKEKYFLYKPIHFVQFENESTLRVYIYLWKIKPTDTLICILHVYIEQKILHISLIFYKTM